MEIDVKKLIYTVILRHLLINRTLNSPQSKFNYLKEMSKTRLMGSVEVTINDAIRRISKLKGQDKNSLQSEFKEWIDAIDNVGTNYDVLYINKIDKL